MFHMECLSTRSPQLLCESLLLCEESLHALYTIGDPVLQSDRVLEQMLSQEELIAINPNYMRTTQLGKVTEHKRKDLVSAMAEVCEQHSVSLHILPMAVNYLDRVLSCSRVQQDELELMAMACLFIAAKLNNADSMAVEKLSQHFFFTSRQLLDMELLVLSKLKWDVYCITPFDYVDLLLPRLTMGAHDQKRFYALVQSLIEVCCLEYHFVVYPPSLIASGCMVSALAMLGIKNTAVVEKKSSGLLELLASTLNVEKEFITACHEQISDYHSISSCPESP
ncbi:G1/S-specific cyclin-D3-like [Sycon ciliatum]|uniref:G1/S-specific cyclin-D3-like n=1 Tax=Sycon ciliatum TaxID=27933 RepID=UPI0020AC9354|eukprot:scpid80647/ scgid22067/ G1/S-specific cyclin-D3